MYQVELPFTKKNCQQCEHYNGNICELEFPNGCCSATWDKFVELGECPLLYVDPWTRISNRVKDMDRGKNETTNSSIDSGSNS